MDFKPTNPKDALALARAPLHLVPSTMTAYASMAFCEGALKYGAYNWRVAGVSASVYRSAALRHFEKWWNGEWADPITGVPHLASLLATVGIILDAELCGKLTDDRPPAAPVSALLDRTPEMVDRLRALFAGIAPRQYTIADTAPNPDASAGRRDRSHHRR